MTLKFIHCYYRSYLYACLQWSKQYSLLELNEIHAKSIPLKSDYDINMIYNEKKEIALTLEKHNESIINIWKVNKIIWNQEELVRSGFHSILLHYIILPDIIIVIS